MKAFKQIAVRALWWIVTGVCATGATAAVPGKPSGTQPGTTSSPGPAQPAGPVALRWQAVAGATYYSLGVRDLATNTLVVDTNAYNNSYAANLAAGKPYRWNVAACNASGCSGYTTALYFQTPAAAKTLSTVVVSCPETLGEGAQASCSAMARFSDGSTQSVTNSVSWTENSPYASINGSGVLVAGAVPSNHALTVTGTYVYGSATRSGSANVTVLDAAPTKTLSSLQVSCPATMNENAQVACTATARFSDNSTQLVSGAVAWSENSSATSISSIGMLTAAQVTANQSVTVTASYVYNGSTRSGSAVVTVNDSPSRYTLTVTKSGGGVVSGNGINCGTGCSASFTAGTVVSLTASPATGQRFSGWGGACSGTGSCTIRLTANTSVSAAFANGSGVATPSVVFGSNPAQYRRLTAQITWGPGEIPAAAAMALNDADVLTFSTSGRTTTAVFMPQLAGAKSWVLKARPGANEPALASGMVNIATAPAFDVQQNTPAYAANPGGRGYCRPQCAEFVQAQLGLPGGRGYAKNFWTNPYTAEGYVNQAQGRSRRPPRPGDIMVWSGQLNATLPLCAAANGCGHVAIVKSVDLASGTLVRVDANWAGTCLVRETTMTVTRDPTTGAYTIGGTHANHLLGWQSKN